MTTITVTLLTIFTASFALGTALGLSDPATVGAFVMGLSGSTPLLISVILLLLVGDLFLPVPATVVMVAAGALLGPVAGTLVNTAGALGGALLGYGLCRRLGASGFTRLVGDDELPEVRARFVSRGAWVVLLSRGVPMATETVSCLAGLVGMSLPLFAGLSLAGALPVSLVYALSGAFLASGEAPAVALAVAFAVPVVAYGALRLSLRR